MKKISLILIAFSLFTIAGAQSAIESYLKRVPVLPRDSCNIKLSDKESFVQQVNLLLDELDKDIEARNEKDDNYVNNNESAMKNNAFRQMQQYGVSNEDIEKIKSGQDMSEADKMAMANRIMMQQTNISMAEAQNLSKMSDEGKKAWAEAYAAEAQANAQANPKAKTVNTDAKNQYQLVAEQQAINAKLSQAYQNIASQYAEIDNDPAKQQMLDRMGKWSAKLTSMMGIDYGQGKQMDSLSNLIKKEQIKYCDKFTPKYRAALRQHLEVLKASQPDYLRLVEVTSQIMKAQTGIAAPPESINIASLRDLQGYLNNLKNAYQYKLYYPEADSYK